MRVHIVVSMWRHDGEPTKWATITDCALKESDARKTFQREKEQVLANYWKEQPYHIEETDDKIYIYDDDDNYDLIVLDERKVR